MVAPTNAAARLEASRSRKSLLLKPLETAQTNAAATAVAAPATVSAMLVNTVVTKYWRVATRSATSKRGGWLRTDR
jgi:hypothetical protein